jgi:hypothetical protein
VPERHRTSQRLRQRLVMMRWRLFMLKILRRALDNEFSRSRICCAKLPQRRCHLVHW